jgi:hypothetical protein
MHISVVNYWHYTNIELRLRDFCGTSIVMINMEWNLVKS